MLLPISDFGQLLGSTGLFGSDVRKKTTVTVTWHALQKLVRVMVSCVTMNSSYSLGAIDGGELDLHEHQRQESECTHQQFISPPTVFSNFYHAPCTYCNLLHICNDLLFAI
jgi:hypothetical protein